MEVTVIRSPKRRKTAQARLVEGVLEVRIPSRVSRAEETRLVEGFRRRFEGRRAGEQVDLAARARRLAKAHGLPRPTEIRWVTNQQHRWGSCTPSTGVIRISHRLADHPTWVLDHVLVHELAHLVEGRHDDRFRALVARYPLAERAEGYLLAVSGGVDPTADPLAGDLDDLDDVDDLGGLEGLEGSERPDPAGDGPGAEGAGTRTRPARSRGPRRPAASAGAAQLPLHPH
ncbi:MAG: hypothetical protein JWM47_2364 [Acidimicrobiales bacterium]|nr:hypothetical protein [Acidimicrobiales bacterium]